MKKGKYLTCSFCNKVFYRPKRKIKKGTKNIYCSHKCHYNHMFIVRLEKAAEPFNESWDKLIYRLYIKEEIPVRQITAKLEVSNRLVPKAIRYLKIPQRSIHERIALQWKDNEQRRKEHSKRTSKLFKGHKPWNKGQTKETNPSTLRQAKWMTGTNNPMYGKRGKAHHCYKNGKYTAEKKRYWNTSEYQQWRKAVYEKDDYTCQKCGDNKGGNLNAHHVKSFVNYPKLRYDVSNGITFCDKCHILVHQSSIIAEIEQRQLLCLGGASISS